MYKVNEVFRRISSAISGVVGSPWAFLFAFGIILVWLVTGPYFGYSDTWQLIINTGTTIVTFLMVFLIQNTQNRDARAIHLKLDELLRAIEGARVDLLDAENLDDEMLDRYQQQFQTIRERYQGSSVAVSEGIGVDEMADPSDAVVSISYSALDTDEVVQSFAGITPNLVEPDAGIPATGQAPEPNGSPLQQADQPENHYKRRRSRQTRRLTNDKNQSAKRVNSNFWRIKHNGRTDNPQRYRQSG